MNRLSLNVRSILIGVCLGLSICAWLLGIPSLVSAQSVPVDAILETPSDSTAAPAAGQFTVSDDGAATYSYPIWVPDGRRDLEPSLSLVYNSQVENGLLGVGWGLSGLSSITRCKRDMARDGFNSTIQFNWDDRFCLDGQRLVSFPSVADGITRNYGTERAEYRTEQEGFAQIINGPVDDLGPLSFEVRLKNGLILFYGTIPDSRLEGKRMNVIANPSGGTVVVQRDFSQMVRLKWALSEVRDRFGNNMIVHYSITGPANQGYEQLPTSIHYTGTVDQSLPARRGVQFIYEARPDIQTSFISGLKLAVRQRLSKITLRAPNPVNTDAVKEYVLHYEISTATKRSLLQKISECDPKAVCLTPTTFAYSFTAEEEDRFTDIGTDIHDVTTGSQGGQGPSFGPRLDRLITGDINGDGCDDLIYSAVGNLGDPGFPGGRRAAYRLSGCRFLSGPPSPATFQQLTWPIADAPNSTHILQFVFNPPYRGPEDTKECFVPSGDVLLKQCYAQLTGIDLDLDGRIDLFSHLVWEDCGKVFPPDCLFSTSWNQTLSTRILLASSIPPLQWNPSSNLFGGMTQFTVPTHTDKPIFSDGPPASWSYISTYIGDINGDGYPDLMKLTPQGWSFQLNHGRAAGQLPLQPNCGTSGQPCLKLDAPSPLFPGTAPKEGLTNVFMTDVFREGTTSLILRDHADTKWYAAYRLSARSCPDGQAFCPMLPAPNLGLMAGDAYTPARRDWFLDVNGDGLPDSVSIPVVGGNTYISINTGNGFDAPVELIWPGVKISSLNAAVMDYDGNGTQDLVASDIRFGELVVMLTNNEPGEPYRWLKLHIQKNRDDGFINSGSNLQTFDVNGDGRMDLVQIVGGRIRGYIRNGDQPDLLTGISDRGGAECHPGEECMVSVSYAPLTRRGLYSTSVPPGVVASSAPSSTYVMNKGPWVVKSYSVARAGSLDQKVRNQYSYTYADGRHDLSGRGWLGFGSVTTVDHQTQAKTIRTYDNVTKVGSAYPFAHRLASVTHTAQLSDNGRTNQQTEYTVYQRSGTDDGRYSVVLPEVVVRQEFEGPSAAISRPMIRDIQTRFEYDKFGNVTKTSSVTGDGYSEDRVFRYQQNLNAWLVSMKTRAEVTSVVPGGARETRTSSYSPDSNTGLTLEEIVEPDGDNDTYLRITHQYDTHGVQTGSTVTDKTGLDTRCSAVQYDAESLYPTVSVNQLGHRTRVAIHPALGTATLFEDANGVREARQYDTFGRLLTVLPANGAKLIVAYPSTGFPIVEATDAAGQVTRISYDAFQHVVGKTWKAFDGQTVTVRTAYNGQNLLEKTEGPCYLGPQTCGASSSERYAYDELGRLLTVTHADGSASRVTYNDLKTTYVDESGNQRSVLEDQRGRLVKSLSINDEGKEVPITYRYAPFGLLASITDSANNTADTQYDIRGRVRSLHEPDLGSQAFQWSPFDDLRESRVGNNRVTTYQHDRLGRVIKMANPDGITQFRWDTAAHGIGRLDRSKSPDGIESVYAYDVLARTNTVTSKIDGKVYDVSLAYDALGRLSTIAYPEVQNQPRFTIQQQFNAFGYLQQVVDAQSQLVYWKIDGVNLNEQGHIIHEAFGNGLATSRRFDKRGFLRTINTGTAGNTIQELTYDYTLNGSLHSRTTRFPDSSLVETFRYDPLDRMREWSASSSSPDGSQTTRVLDHVFGYDDLGNLRSRSMVNSREPRQTLTYVYGENGAGPHAVTHVNDDAYGYDPGGNQITAPGRTISYTSFDLPSRIVTGSRQFEFQYDAFRVRSVMGDSTGDRTTYIGGLYEKRVHNGHTTHVFYVAGLSGTIAQIKRDETTGKQSILYLHHDRLASVQATTDQTGTITGRANYEPFGGVVDAADPSKFMPNALGGVTLGFTEHSMDTELNLINMTGRIYDPTIGRFLTPDPLPSNPAQSESLNPYSYVWNNPLKWVDPSGFEEEEAPKKKKGEEKWPETIKVCCEVIVVTGNRKTGKSTSISYWENIGTSTTYDDNGMRDSSMRVRPETGCEGPCQLAQAMFNPETGPRPFTHYDKAVLGYIAAAPLVAMAGAITSVVGSIEASVTVYQVAPRAWKAVLGVLSGLAGAPQSAPESAAATEPSRIYSARELIRRAEESGPYHNFPESLNRQIFQQGTRTVTPNFFNFARPGLTRDGVMYELRGSVNGTGGTFQIGVRPSISGNIEVIGHRFFKKD